MGKFHLRTKREIDVAKAKDRQREIDEGMKLAKRVDTLRNTLPQEEKALDEFRVNTLTKIQSEIDPKVKELELLNTQVRERKTELEVLMQPIEEKYNLLTNMEDMLREREETIAQQESQLMLSIAANIQRERENEVERGRIQDDRTRTTENLMRSEKMVSNAQKILSDSNEKDVILNAALALREKSVSSKEEKINTEREYIEKRVRELDVYEQKLFLRELNLKDNERLSKN